MLPLKFNSFILIIHGCDLLILSLFIFLAAGFITPTIDGYTQLSFAISSVSLYIIIINLLEKRVNVKFNTTSILG